MEPSEDVLRGLLSAAPDALLAISIDGLIVFMNDQAEVLFGWPKTELVGQPVERVVPERFGARHPALRAGYLAAPATRPMGAGLELRALRRDGSDFAADISLSTFTTSSGTLVAAAIRDVTSARRSERRFRAVLSAAPDAIIGAGASGKIELVNAQVERLFGWAADELVGQQIEVLVPAGFVDRHIAHRASYVADPQVRVMGNLALSARRKDGSTFPAEIGLSAVTDDVGGLLVLAAVRDISARIELEAERQRLALEAQREHAHRLESLGQLAAGVAHDFNNLLGVILNYTTLVNRKIVDPVIERDLAEIRAAAERGAALTGQLLTFARRDIVEPQPVDVAAVARGVASMLERTLEANIVLTLDVRDSGLVVTGDPHQLEQILLNLAINARDAMPDGGILTITAQRGADEDGPRRVLLRVSDTGHGMPPDVVARAFEPFFTTKPRGQGTGLGLATIYGIVRQHGGDVSIDSKVGEGTVVTVSLSGIDGVGGVGGVVGVVGAGVDYLHAEDIEGGHETILLVEDEPPLRAATARLLTDQGYVVLTAADGSEAFDVIEQAHGDIDLVLTDIVMPRMDGRELARAVKKRFPLTPVILMSGYDSGQAPLAGRLLTKPVTEITLLQAIREELGD